MTAGKRTLIGLPAPELARLRSGIRPKSVWEQPPEAHAYRFPVILPPRTKRRPAVRVRIPVPPPMRQEPSELAQIMAALVVCGLLYAIVALLFGGFR